VAVAFGSNPQSDARGARGAQADDRPGGAEYRILIVEDERIVALDIEDTIKALGYQVAGRAASGEDAIEQAAKLRPDLILMDIRLGSGIDGIVAARQIAERQGCPVIYLTATGDERTLLRAKQTNPYGYLIKPFKAQELRCAMEVALHKHDTEVMLREQDRWFSTTLRALGDAVAITDAAGNIKFLNPVAEALTGWNDADAVGRPVEEILPLRSNESALPVDNPIRRALVDAKAQTLAEGTILLGRTGIAIPIGDKATRIVDDDGRLLGGVMVFRDITEQHTTQERIRHLAEHDPLTGLPNRLLFRDRVGQTITQARRHQHGVGILFIDLDRFKDINDSLGHEVGDRVLILVADRLKACLREGDTVARFGGDEFVVNLPGLIGNSSAQSVAGKILDSLREPFSIDGHELHISASIGISLYPLDGEDAEHLMRAADAAMYHAKEHGRDQSQFYTQRLNSGGPRRLEIAACLHHAIERNEFSLEFQPIVEMKGDTIIAAEALVRWPHPEIGPVPTSEFIKVAEDMGLIAQIGEWVLRQACVAAKGWRESGFPNLRVAVNVSPHQIRRPVFPELIAFVLDDVRVAPEALVLEITESLLITQRVENIAILQQLSRLGIGLAVDDFGTGYSSLAYIQRFPIEYLKIDRSFLQGLGLVERDTALVTAIIAMARGLQIEVIAEGVETAEQAEFFRKQGCLAAQGYYFGRPAPAREFSQLLGAPKGAIAVG
jgi:diguanylate cyclase (GGDEF)-like protein/PAS domain S-box-containing protein